MLAEIIAIGSELTCGSKLDTNSQWLSRELEALGWTVARHTTLSDDMDAIVAEFRAASERAQVLLITGGLGPTLDDITRDALSISFDQPLIRDAESLKQIEALFVARGRAMPERNQRQADRPEKSEALPNGCGTAPGILMLVAPTRTRKTGTGTFLESAVVDEQSNERGATCTRKTGTGTSLESAVVDEQSNERGASPRFARASCLIAVMPGVPAEMKPMFELQVKPRLPGSGMVLCRRAIRTFGYGESEAERLLGDLTARGRNPEVGITASEAVISLWVTARSQSSVDAERSCEDTCALIRARLGETVYAEGDAELHEVVGKLLRSRSQKIALVEGSTTGGLLAMWMTEDSELSSVVGQAIVVPALWKDQTLDSLDADLPRTSNQTTDWDDIARDCVQGLLRAHSLDYALVSSPFQDNVSDTGVAVRCGFVGIAAPGIFETFDVSMSGNLAIFRQRAARTALNRLRLLMEQL